MKNSGDSGSVRVLKMVMIGRAGLAFLVVMWVINLELLFDGKVVRDVE